MKIVRKLIKIKSNLFIIFTSCFIFSGCSNFKRCFPLLDLFNFKRLPKHPESIIINWYEFGGMLPESKEIYLSEDSCYFISYTEGIEQKVFFKVSKEELMSLYRVFYSEDFDNIRTYEEKVYDRGGSSINIKVNKVDFKVVNGGFSFICHNYRDNYYAIENEIMKLANVKIEKQKVNVLVNLDTTIINYPYNVILYVNRHKEYEKNKDGIINSIDLKLLPMNNVFAITFWKPINDNRGWIIDKSYRVIIEHFAEKDTIFLSIDGNKLLIK